MAVTPDQVAIYIRWSTEDQAEGTTLEVQLEGCRHYVLSQGWQVRPDLIFIDDGYSGATLERPALTRLREQVRQGAVTCVVVYKLDRLSRSVADTARLCMDEWEGVCCVKSAREPLDTQSQAGRMFFYTLMNYAEWERSVIRDRTHAGRVRRAQEGRNPGITCPYGYTWDAAAGRFTAVPQEAVIIRRIFDAYRAGAGLAAIVAQLNREGVPFREGRRWRVGTVAYLLANRAYLGELVWGRRMRNPRAGRRAGERQVLWREEPLARVAGAFDAIVTPEVFEQVQAVRRQRPSVGRGGGRAVASAYLLTGLLRCGLCGGALVGARNHPRRTAAAAAAPATGATGATSTGGAAQGGGTYYCCTTRRGQGKAACPAPHIPCHALDGLVARQLLSLPGARRAQEQALAALAGDGAGRLEGARAELARLERSLARLQEQERRLLRQYNDQVLTLDEFRRLRGALQADMAELTPAREALQARVRALELAAGDRAALAGAVAQLRLWDDLTVGQRKELLRQFLAKVRAHREESGVVCEVTWKVAPAGA